MKRLLEGSLSTRAATLLRSAAADVPPRAVEEKGRLVSVVASETVMRGVRGRLASGKWLGVLSIAVVAAVGSVGSGYSRLHLGAGSAASDLNRRPAGSSGAGIYGRERSITCTAEECRRRRSAERAGANRSVGHFRRSAAPAIVQSVHADSGGSTSSSSSRQSMRRAPPSSTTIPGSL